MSLNFLWLAHNTQPLQADSPDKVSGLSLGREKMLCCKSEGSFQEMNKRIFSNGMTTALCLVWHQGSEEHTASSSTCDADRVQLQSCSYQLQCGCALGFFGLSEQEV